MIRKLMKKLQTKQQRDGTPLAAAAAAAAAGANSKQFKQIIEHYHKKNSNLLQNINGFVSKNESKRKREFDTAAASPNLEDSMHDYQETYKQLKIEPLQEKATENKAEEFKIDFSNSR